MKYVHSMWSTPAIKDNFDNDYDKKYLTKNFYSYLFSALLIKKMGHEIELFCDEKSYDIYSLIPYDKIHIVNFDGDGVDAKFWIYGKIKTHLLMNEPYIHVDGDVFLFNDIVGNKPNNYDVVVQSIENELTMHGSYNIYNRSLTPFLTLKNFKDIKWNKYNLAAFNCGVVGFNDLKFKNKYANTVKDLLIQLSNGGDFKKYRNKYAGMFLIAEQSLLYYLVKEHGIKYSEIIPYDEIVKKKYDWFSIATEIGYCHMWGYSKYRPEVINAIKNKINNNFPQNNEILENFERRYL